MGEKVQLKGGIYEVNFGYNVMRVYANLSSDIPKLSEIATLRISISSSKRGKQ